jgi:type IV secretion system protein VirB9
MPEALYQVYVAVPNATTILLQPGEYFHQAVIGDKGKWSTSEIAAGSSAGERGGVVVNCTEPGARSNLTIAASKRVYLLDLHCTASTYHAQVSWTYPEDRGPGVLKGARPTPEASVAPPVVRADAPSGMLYTVTSNRPVGWLPTHVYDTGVQGKQTYIVFPPALGVTDAPVLYTKTLEGNIAVANYRVKQGYLVRDRMYEAADLQKAFGSMGEPVTYYVLDQISDVLQLRVGEKKPTIVTITRQQPGA